MSPSAGQGDSNTKGHPFDLNAAILNVNEMDLKWSHDSSSGANARQVIEAADVEVHQIQRRAEEARTRWEAAEKELRMKGGLHLPSLEKCLGLSTSLSHYGTRSPGPSATSQSELNVSIELE